MSVSQPTPFSIRHGSLEPARTSAELRLQRAALEYSLDTALPIDDPNDLQSKTHWSDSVEPFTHQIRNLLTFCRKAPVALIADDVGLGKTISAGLILSELRSRRKVRRALILCPRILMEQWREELREKFSILAHCETGAELDGVAEVMKRDGADVLITTYASARGRLEKLSALDFDMLILDEAHQLRNLFGSSQAPRIAEEVYAALAARSFKYALLLTATPIQNRLWDLYSLLACLAAAKGHVHPLGTPDEFAERYIADSRSTARRLAKERKPEFRRILGDYMVRARRADCQLVFPERHVQTVRARPSREEQKLVDRVAQLLPTLSPLLQISVGQALMSSPQALLRQLRRMSDNGGITKSDLRDLDAIGSTIGETAKLRRLKLLIEEIREREARDGGTEDSWRVVVFTNRRETQNAIGRTLEEAGIRIGYVRGAAPVENERTIAAFRQDPPGIHVLISTDSGAEGVNLQCANILVNYDLPWNPMVVEQRIGRVQRLASKHRHVMILNLVVEDSVEEVVVERLVEKLQAIAQTIGDIDGILSTSTLPGDSDEGFSGFVRRMVVRAMQGQDVRQSMQRIRQDLDSARQIYQAERDYAEETLENLDAMHQRGPKLAPLKGVQPSLSEKEFTLEAFKSEGFAIDEETPGRFTIRDQEGASTVVETVRFEDSTTEEDDATTVYRSGRPEFERLVGHHGRRRLVQVEDRRPFPSGLLEEGVGRFLRSLPGAFFTKIDVLGTDDHFQGRMTFLANVAVAHDRYGKLVDVETAPTDHVALPPTSIDTPHEEPQQESQKEAWVGEDFDVEGHVTRSGAHCREAIQADPELSRFRRFYLERRLEEFEKAQGQAQCEAKIREHFTPSLDAELTSVQGSLYCSVDVRVSFKFHDSPEYSTRLTLVALTGQVLASAPLVRCEKTGRLLPEDAFVTCALSGSTVDAAALITSEVSGRRALPEYAVQCEVTGQTALVDEVGVSDYSGRRALLRLVIASSLSDQRGLIDEMRRCDFTDQAALRSELEESDVSGRLYRKDEEATSALSGTRGHRSEFVACCVSGDLLLEAEAGLSDVSGRPVRRDRLVASQKSPWRFGLLSECVACGVTGRNLLSDEARQSDVSSAWADPDEMVRSSVSGRWMLPNESVDCAETGATLAPDEASTCSVSGLRVDQRLLRKSVFSEREALPRFLARCHVTGREALDDELVPCAITAKRVLPDRLSTCLLTGRRALQELMVPIGRSDRYMLPSESESQTAAVHDKRVG